MKTVMARNIKTLLPSLLEIGKIKIGRKGQTKKSAGGTEFKLPEKLDYFLITTLDRDKEGNFIKDKEIHKSLGEKPTSIPIMLLFNSIEGNFQSRYARYDGTTCVCAGDGEKAITSDEKEIECPCEKADPKYDGKDKCKMNGTLSCMIRDVNRFGSCWKFRTTGFNSIQNLYSSLLLIMTMTGGQLAGIDLNLILVPKMAVNPTTGKPVKIYVAGIEFAGSMQNLIKTAHEFKQLQSGEQQLLEAEIPNLIDDDLDEQDHIEEFYPEQAEGFKETVDTETGEVIEESEGEVEVVEKPEPEPEEKPTGKKKLSF